MVIAAVTVVTAWQIKGQSPQDTTTPDATLAFEVASIKPIAPPIPPGGGPWIINHGRFKAETCYVRGMIGLAYGVLAALVKDGPDWLDQEPYNIEARAENPEAGPKQIRVMLQTLLTDRFKLAVHRETRQEQVCTLIVGKSGSKLQDAGDGRKNFINWTGPGEVTFVENTALLGLTNVLGGLLSAPVLDKTNLKGSYNFSLKFVDPRFPHPTDDPRPDLFTAVQEQLGLKLQAAKGPVEVLVVDRIERPSAN